MKTLVSDKPKNEKSNVEHFSVKRCLAGLDFDGSSEALLKYLNFFSLNIPVESACFIHVLPRPNLFNLYGNAAEPATFEDIEVNKEITGKLRSQVRSTLSSLDPSRFSVEIREGNPLEELLKTARINQTDLVVIGHNVSSIHHGILTKNFARQVGCNALVVPSKVKCALKKILIPVDFSPNSAQALRTGIAINQQLEKPVKIGLLHTYSLPANFSAYRFNESKVLEMLKEDRVNALDDFIEANVPEANRRQVEPILLQHDHFSIGKHITTFAGKNHYDLIIMGAKGHSKVALLLMGSVTEKVLSLSEKVPVLIVK